MWTMKPTCCIRLKTSLKFIALIDLLVAAFLLAVSVGAFIFYEERYPEAIEFLNDPPEEFSLFLNLRNVEAMTIRILLSFCAFYYLQKVFLGIIIFFAAVKESKFLLRLWILYTFVLLLLHILIYLGMLMVGMCEPWSIPVYVGCFLIREYFMWVASTFLHRLAYCLTDDLDDYSSACGGDDDTYTYKL